MGFVPAHELGLHKLLQRTAPGANGGRGGETGIGDGAHRDHRDRASLSRNRLSWVANLPIGTKGESKLRVTPDIAVSFLGPENARVLGTPYLISQLEFTGRNSVLPFWRKATTPWARAWTCAIWRQLRWAWK